MASSAFPLAGQLVDGGAAFQWLSRSIADARGPIDLCSAYLRSEALARLLPSLPPGTGGRVLVRWRLEDFLAGASDIAAYEVATLAGLEVYMRLTFHGKAYSVPPAGILVGSANATLSGLGVSSNSNDEICTLVQYDSGNRRIINSLFDGATLVDAKLFGELRRLLDLANPKFDGAQEWPVQLLGMLSKRREVETLLVDECFWSSPNWIQDHREAQSFGEKHDQALLSLQGVDVSMTPCLSLVASKFSQSAACSWLKLALKKLGGEAYFGQLSAALHAALMDDPAPRRQEVKALLQNLLSWTDALDISCIRVDRPRFSQRVRLLS